MLRLDVLGRPARHASRAAPAGEPSSISHWPGGDRHDVPIRHRRELLVTALAAAVTAIAVAAFVVGGLREAASAPGAGQAASQVTFVLLASGLACGALLYQLCRWGHVRRHQGYRRTPEAALAAVHLRPPRLSVLVPSYREEPRVVRQTLLSAALQELSGMRVVLLIDDPPEPSGRHDASLLAAARALPREIERLLATPAAMVAEAMTDFRGRTAGNTGASTAVETVALAELCERVAEWFERTAADEPVRTHTDALFVRQVLRAPAAALRDRAATLRRAAVRGEDMGAVDLELGYRRLAALFDVEVTSFERKAYASLSHEPNKAMNLNSYLGLLGGRWRGVHRADGLHLERAAAGTRADLEVPDADYVITLDADSIVLSDYALRLVHLLEQPANARIAVAQTPYSAVPGAPGELERVAGATTDLQYLIHQGFTRFGATFWVGANAVLRMTALREIAEEADEDGRRVTRYVQDRTVIEDTESSIDLRGRGWQLVNVPERLSFSATPPDFGSLVIQRRRWANGGLIILPKLLGLVARRRLPLREVLPRLHYLSSIAAVNVSLLVLFALPFDAPASSAWLPVGAMAYFGLYARDLRQAGYRHRDVVHVGALNLLLVPVNLGGVLKSLQQAIGGRKIPFGRTPKVEGHTPAPRLYLLAEVALLGYWMTVATWDVATGRLAHAALGAGNAALLVFAITRFVGWRSLVADCRRAGRPRAGDAVAPTGRAAIAIGGAPEGAAARSAA